MNYELVNADCLTWLEKRRPNSIHAVVTDPPFGLKEFQAKEVKKMRAGKGGVWRIPPKIGGVERSPLPRFTVLNDRELDELVDFFTRWASLVNRVLVPGGHVFVASNSLLAPWLFSSIAKGGLESRGQVIRLVRTLRGGDRPKGAEVEFTNVSTMPRSCHEPWGGIPKASCWDGRRELAPMEDRRPPTAVGCLAPPRCYPLPAHPDA